MSAIAQILTNVQQTTEVVALKLNVPILRVAVCVHVTQDTREMDKPVRVSSPCVSISTMFAYCPFLLNLRAYRYTFFLISAVE